MSPELGEFDADAFAELWSESPDVAATLALGCARATDERLRDAALTAARQLVIRLASAHHQSRSGVAKRRVLRNVEGDLDLDASVDAIIHTKLLSTQPSVEDLMMSTWRTSDRHIVVAIDTSGSMTPVQVLIGCVAAASLVQRSPETSVLAFSSRPMWVNPPHTRAELAGVFDTLISLKPAGATNLASALRAGIRAFDGLVGAKHLLVISDGQANEGPPLDTVDLGDIELTIFTGAETAGATEVTERLGGRVIVLDQVDSVGRRISEALR